MLNLLGLGDDGWGRLILSATLTTLLLSLAALPGLSNVWQMSLKDSALVSVTGIVELMRASQIAAGSTRDYFLFYLIGGGCYLLLTLLSNRAFIKAETRLNRAWQRRTVAQA